jgi:hypothetical protein
VNTLGSVAIAGAAAAAGGAIDAVWFMVLLLLALAWTIVPLSGILGAHGRGEAHGGHPQ